MKIGIVLAVELDAIFMYYKEVKELKSELDFPLYYISKGDNEIYVIKSNVGLVHAAMATQYLISKYHVDLILNFGVVGALTTEISKTDICIVSHAVHYNFDLSEIDNVPRGLVQGEKDIYIPASESLIEKSISLYPTLKKVVCCSGDKFVSDKIKKKIIAKEFNADVCDMEVVAILLTANHNNVPVISIKAISDALSEGGSEYYIAYKKAALKCIEAADKIIQSL